MANLFKGEMDLEINGVVYPMVVDMDVVAEFENDTGVCFVNLAIKSVNRMLKTRSIDDAMDRAELMTDVITKDFAARLFYLAAKKKNSQVEFGEMQEAVMLEGAIDSLSKSYPLLFAALVEFAVTGGKVKKKT